MDKKICDQIFELGKFYLQVRSPSFLNDWVMEKIREKKLFWGLLSYKCPFSWCRAKIRYYNIICRGFVPIPVGTDFPILDTQFGVCSNGHKIARRDGGKLLYQLDEKENAIMKLK